jgi:replicative DNA helicase
VRVGCHEWERARGDPLRDNANHGVAAASPSGGPICASYAQIVADHALRRRFIGAAQRVAEIAWDVRQDIDTVRQRSEALVLGAATDTLTGQEILAPDAWTDHLLKFLDRSRTGGLAGVSTGLRDLDGMTLGLSPGLYLLAASTGTGKTAMADAEARIGCA